MGFLIRLAITAVALWVTTLIVPGVDVTGRNGANTALTLIVVALIFGVVNAVLKPVIKVFGCVFYLLTLGSVRAGGERVAVPADRPDRRARSTCRSGWTVSGPPSGGPS